MTSPSRADRTITLLERWLEGMRGPDGYGGPVVHWWRDSLTYCGPALDWRYEGIIHGYLSLYERTSVPEFLDRAKRAGDDLVRGQLPDGTFQSSSFERNPAPGGTPHEAAVDVALLRLAATLRGREDELAGRYIRAAERNIDEVLIGRLWRARERRFADGGGWFVPNKAATIIEALGALVEVSGRGEYVPRYIAPTADAIVSLQVTAPGGALDGAIAQASRATISVDRYFPYYVARSIPGLSVAYRLVGNARYLDAAVRSASFVMRWQDVDGGWPQVIYSQGRINRYPRWIAAAGDVLTALGAVAPYGFRSDADATLRWICDGQLPNGAIRTAIGFRSRVSQRRARGLPDARDLLPVVGWNDKAFRALSQLGNVVPGPRPTDVDLDCFWRGRPARFHDDPSAFSVDSRGTWLYRWRKHRRWAEWRPGR